MLSHVSWAHKIYVGGGDGHVRWSVKKKKIYVYILKKMKKKTYLGPK